MDSIKTRPKLKTKLEPKTRVEQGLVLTLALQEALAVLEMPLPELAQWLQKQIEENPALQFAEEERSDELEQGSEALEDTDSTFTFFPDPALDEPSWIEQISSPPCSLHDHLLKQAREVLSSRQDLEAMEQLIGNLDERGFLSDPHADPYLAELLQSFDPPGIAARDVQHCLLLQLERTHGKQSFPYRLIQHHYDDFIQGRKEMVCQQLSCSFEELERTIQTTLSSLSLNPAASFQNSTSPVQIPDIFIEPSDQGWSIILNDSLLPSFQFNSSPELSRFETSARWVEKILSRRHQIMTRIVQVVLEVQAPFFQGTTSDLEPLSFKQVAKKLSLHESTVSRAVKEKYVACPRGIFPLRYFFPPAASSSAISNHTAKERMKELIHRENKQKPLSDEELKQALQVQGISCARRTVTKYRKSLKIPPASQRKVVS